jgi:hypothetical protein
MSSEDTSRDTSTSNLQKDGLLLSLAKDFYIRRFPTPGEKDVDLPKEEDTPAGRGRQKAPRSSSE